jgi:hypothetical protein
VVGSSQVRGSVVIVMHIGRELSKSHIGAPVYATSRLGLLPILTYHTRHSLDLWSLRFTYKEVLIIKLII